MYEVIRDQGGIRKEKSEEGSGGKERAEDRSRATAEGLGIWA